MHPFTPCSDRKVPLGVAPGPGPRDRSPVKLLSLAFVAFLFATPAFADDTQTAPKTTPTVASHGLAVVGVGDAVDATWPLAQSVYANETLRPTAIDETQARVLAGETPDANAPREIKDLADLRAGVHGD